MARIDMRDVRDRVVLRKTVDPLPHGWAGYGHFLIAGARAVVCDLDFGKNGFSYGVLFEDESWIGRDGTVNPAREKGQFWLSEADLSGGYPE